jgi:hypothetical protein
MTNKIINVDNYPIYTPVLFMVFNRIDVTEDVFSAIRKAKPLKLYFSVDGARENIEGELEKVNDVINTVLNNIDWECEVKTLIREENLGCKNAISSAIDWVFENEDQAIILEDDCVPSFSFFVFCQEMLKKYKSNENIMHINGAYYLDGIYNTSSSYYLSKLNGVWGWATWKKAWNCYNSSMEGYLEDKEDGLISRYFENRDIDYWMTQYFDDVYFNQEGSNWDPVWSYAIAKNNAFCISPTVNLVKNIGFTASSSTHGSSASFSKYEDFENEEISSITHPDILIYNPNIDAIHMQTIIKLTDPIFLVKDFKYYFRKMCTLNQYPIYLSKIKSNIWRIIGR